MMSLVMRTWTESIAAPRRADPAARNRRTSSADNRYCLPSRAGFRSMLDTAPLVSILRKQSDTPGKAFSAASHSKQRKAAHAKCHTFSRPPGTARLVPSLPRHLQVGALKLPPGHLRTPDAREIKWHTGSPNFYAKPLKTKKSHPNKAGHFYDSGFGG